MQQINLYQPMFRQEKKIFSAVTMLQIVGFFLVVLTAVYAWNVRSLAPFQAELAKTDADFERLVKQIEKMRAPTAADAERKLIDREIAALTREIAVRRNLQKLLTTRSFGNTEGFSSYFEALAQGHVDGAWLTDIRIAQGGGRLTLKGKTVDPELVPVYIKRLAETPAFRKRGFSVLELARSEKEQQLVSFNIATGG